MRKKVLGVLVFAILMIGIGIWMVGAFKEMDNFRKSLEGMSREAAQEARLERAFGPYELEKKAAYRLIWSIKTGDVLVILDSDEKEKIGIASQQYGALYLVAPRTDLWWRTTLPEPEQVLRFSRSFRKVIHMDDPRWCEYARWVYGGPKPKSVERP